MSRIDYGSDLKSLFDTCFMTGTITDINWENDTATVNDISDVPIFYHCEGHTSSVEQGSSAFSSPSQKAPEGVLNEGSAVLIINHTGAANPGASDLKIVAFADGFLRDCCYCPEDSTGFDCDENNPENIDKGESAAISVVAGCPLYTWEIDPADSGFWFDAGYSLTKIEDTMSETQTVYADTEDETESATIKVTDRCGNTAECEVKTCDCDVEPDVAYDNDTSDDTIDRQDTATIAVIGGCPPYAWSVAGTGFWFDAEYTLTEIETTAISTILYADETACGAAAITVTDFCQDNCIGYVRCTEGEWVCQGYAIRGEASDPDKCTSIGGEASCVPWSFNEYVGNERWYYLNVSCMGHRRGVDDPCDVASIGWDIQPLACGGIDNWKQPSCGNPPACPQNTCTGDCNSYPCASCAVGGCYYYIWSCP